MTKKERYIKSTFSKWIRRLGLLWWHVDILYYDDPGEIVRKFATDTPSWVVLMNNQSDWKYSQTQINVNLPALLACDDDDIEHHIVHELIHTLVNEMREGELHHEERVVEQLAKAFIWTVEDATPKVKK